MTGTLRIPDTVMEIGERCFQFCSGPTRTILPENLKFMGQGALELCGNFTGTLYIPESLTVISCNAFYRCGNLTGLVLSDSVTEISGSAFMGCAGLEGTLALPDSVTEIGGYAFGGCDSLSRIQTGKGLNRLGESAFPDGAALGAYSERVLQLLAENTNLSEEGSLVLLWDGRADIPADKSVSVWECTLDFTLNEDRKTYTAVIGEVGGAEYSFDGTTWSESNKKENCQPRRTRRGHRGKLTGR